MRVIYSFQRERKQKIRKGLAAHPARVFNAGAAAL
jgi:hypothetical protein